MKEAFIVALALASTVVNAGEIKIESPDYPHYLLRHQAAKEMRSLFYAIGDEKITLQIHSGYISNEGHGMQYVQVQIPEKNLYYTYNGPDGIRQAIKPIDQMRKGISYLTGRIKEQ